MGSTPNLLSRQLCYQCGHNAEHGRSRCGRDVEVHSWATIQYGVFGQVNLPSSTWSGRQPARRPASMVAQECTSTSRPQRDRPCSALCPHYVRTTSVVFPHRFRSISAIFPHCSRGISALLLLRSLSAPFPRYLRSLSALFPRSFRSLSAPFPQPFRIVSAVLGSFLQVLAIDHRQ